MSKPRNREHNKEQKCDSITDTALLERIAFLEKEVENWKTLYNRLKKRS